jgi:hypothetical protein
MDRLLKRIQRVRSADFCSRDFFFLNDTAPAHKAACTSICQLLTEKNYTTLYHPLPPYSPDLSPPDYFLFPMLKMKVKGLRVADVAEIHEDVTYELKKIQKGEFSETVPPRKSLYMYANGAYFE